MQSGMKEIAKIANRKCLVSDLRRQKEKILTSNTTVNESARGVLILVFAGDVCSAFCIVLYLCINCGQVCAIILSGFAHPPRFDSCFMLQRCSLLLLLFFVYPFCFGQFYMSINFRMWTYLFDIFLFSFDTEILVRNFIPDFPALMLSPFWGCWLNSNWRCVPCSTSYVPNSQVADELLENSSCKFCAASKFL